MSTVFLSAYLVKSEPETTKECTPYVRKSDWFQANCSPMMNGKSLFLWNEIPIFFFVSYCFDFLKNCLKTCGYSTCYLVNVLCKENYLFGHSLHWV